MGRDNYMNRNFIQPMGGLLMRFSFFFFVEVGEG